MDNEYSLLGRTTPDGKYRFDELIGRGSFAHVYRVKHIHLDIDRALKVLHRDWSEIGSKDIRNFRDRFEIEAQLVARIHKNGIQPHVIQVFDFVYDEQSGLLYQEMEYASGGNLASLIQRSRDDDQFVPIYTALRWVIEASEGLASLHKIDIVHRDVKPANILLGADGKIKIADLGLAQTPGSRIGQGSLAIDHPGTTEYMPPEQLPGQKLALRASADVYALGCVLFEALTGRIYYHHFNSRIHDLRPDVPQWLDDLSARCLSQNSADRPRDGSQLADLLRSGEEHQRATDQLKLSEKIDKFNKLAAEALKRQDLTAASQYIGELRLLGAEGQSAAEALNAQVNQYRRMAEELERKRLSQISAQKAAELKRLTDAAENALKAGKTKTASDIASQLKAFSPEGMVIAERILAKVAEAEQTARDQARQQQEQRKKDIFRFKQLADTALLREEWKTVRGLIEKLNGLGPEGVQTAKNLQQQLIIAQQEANRRDQAAVLLKWQSLVKSKSIRISLVVLLMAIGLFALVPLVTDVIGGQIVERDAARTVSAVNTQTYTAQQAVLTKQQLFSSPQTSNTPFKSPSATKRMSVTGITSTFTLTPTSTYTLALMPTNTSVTYWTNTPKPPATSTPKPLPTNTPRPPDPTNTPIPQPTNTPVPPQPTATSDVRPPTPTPP